MFLVLFAAAAVGGTAAPVTQPSWRTQPSAEQLSAVYPARAAQQHIAGRATIECTVNVNGLLEACRVTSESPPAQGFGAAALVLAPTFNMNPAMGPDGPVPARIVIPIVWSQAGGSSADVAASEPPSVAHRRPGSVTFGGGNDSHGDNLIMHPIWTSAPTFAEVGAVYPAAAAGAAGHVVLRCRVAANGGLGACATVVEEPADRGFARASRQLVGRFRVSAASLPARDGDPVFVDVPFRLVDPHSDAFQQRRTGAPTWRLGLDPTKVARVYPDEAAAKGVTTGRGVAKCAVAADGGLTACQEMPANPDGLGFSHSAVVVANAMAMNPWTDEGDPVDGATVIVPIRFNLAADAGSPPDASH